MYLLFFSWFYSTKRFKIKHSNLIYLSNTLWNFMKNHCYQKCIKGSFNWVYWTNNWTCVFDIDAHNDQSCTGIEPTFLFLANILNDCASYIKLLQRKISCFHNFLNFYFCQDFFQQTGAFIMLHTFFEILFSDR